RSKRDWSSDVCSSDLLGIRTAPTSKPPLDIGISDLLFEIEQEARTLGHVLMDETEWYPRTSHMPGLLYDIAHHYGHWTNADDNKIGRASCRERTSRTT